MYIIFQEDNFNYPKIVKVCDTGLEACQKMSEILLKYSEDEPNNRVTIHLNESSLRYEFPDGFITVVYYT